MARKIQGLTTERARSLDVCLPVSVGTYVKLATYYPPFVYCIYPCFLLVTPCLNPVAGDIWAS